MTKNSSHDSEEPLNLPKTINSKLVLDKFIKVRCDHLQLNNGNSYDYYCLTPKADAVIIVGLTSDGKYVLNEEYRHPVAKTVLCFPGGYIDANETPEIAAKRELLEETGYEANEFVFIGSAYPYPGISEQLIYYVLAKNAKKVAEPKLDPSEIMRTILKTKKDLEDAIRSNKPIDGIMCTALYLYDLHTNR